MPERYFVSSSNDRTILISTFAPAAYKVWRAREPGRTRRWLETTGFKPVSGAYSLIAAATGELERIVLCADPADREVPFAALAAALAPGRYMLDGKKNAALSPDLARDLAHDAAFGWGLAQYRFDSYRRNGKEKIAARRAAPRLVWPDGCDRKAVLREVRATRLVRDLINTPARDMGPAALAAAVKAVSRHHQARTRVIRGDALLGQNYPLIHAVGAAASAANAPALIDLRWGNARHPKVTLVGKGVCFDSGGLDLKPSGGMLLMKKDMGGGANALGLAQMIMEAKLPVRLRLLIPAVENAVSGDALRPMDIIKSRKGLTVEIGNTDAEGRLVLCDALTEADREKPAMILDFATLTGAARVALGHDLPALFSNDDTLADDLLSASRDVGDPLWRLPLWRPYRGKLDSKTADINNVSDGAAAGAITAALYLEEFVSSSTPWAHIDLMGWNLAARPGHPVGGEAMGMRASFAMIAARYGWE